MTMDGTVTWEYPQVKGETITQVVNDRHNYGPLIKWLKKHNEDTLEDSFGHKKLAEICEDGTILESYDDVKGGPPKASGKSRPAREPSPTSIQQQVQRCRPGRTRPGRLGRGQEEGQEGRRRCWWRCWCCRACSGSQEEEEEGTRA